MTTRQTVKHGLQRLGLEVVIRPADGPRGWHRARLTRFHLPGQVSATRNRPATHALRVPIDRMVNRAGFGYGTAGWHPYVAALEQYLDRPDLPYEATILARFYDVFRPRTVHELLFEKHDRSVGALATWPAVDPLIDLWSVTAERVGRVLAQLGDAQGLPHSQYRGPAPRDAGAMHLHRVVRFYEGVRATGYRPLEHAAGLVTGYFVTRGDDYRFVVGHGNHRVAALRVLGHTELPVRLRPSHPPVVSRERLARWTVGQGGLLTPGEAEAALHALVSGDGRRRARELQLL